MPFSVLRVDVGTAANPVGCGVVVELELTDFEVVVAVGGEVGEEMSRGRLADSQIFFAAVEFGALFGICFANTIQLCFALVHASF